MADEFSWRDGERLVRFGSGVAAEAPTLLEQHGFGDFTLLTTERAQSSAPALIEAATGVVHVPAGRVDEISAELLDGSGGALAAGTGIVALGGGRVVDTAKALSLIHI